MSLTMWIIKKRSSVAGDCYNSVIKNVVKVIEKETPLVLNLASIKKELLESFIKTKNDLH